MYQPELQANGLQFDSSSKLAFFLLMGKRPALIGLVAVIR